MTKGRWTGRRLEKDGGSVGTICIHIFIYIYIYGLEFSGRASRGLNSNYSTLHRVCIIIYSIILYII